MVWFLVLTTSLIFLLGVCLAVNSRQTKILKNNLAILEAKVKEKEEKETILLQEFNELKTQFSHNLLYDALTGLPTRVMFDDHLEQALNQSKRYNLTFGVLCLDLDDFKVINNALGHDVGDELLKEAANRLKHSIRQIDTVCRFGGDEFVFILTQLSKPESVVYVAQRCLNVLSLPFKIGNQDLYITASIGIATYPLDGESGKVLLKNADNALHQAKGKGRDTYQFYREAMHRLSQRELILSTSLQSENIFKEFVIYYQPTINENKEISSIQALLFWKHPDLGMIALNDFIKTAENGGRLHLINEWLLRTACKHLQEWRRMHQLPLAVAITIQPRQLENSNFVYKISQILQEVELEPHSLIIEISETFLITEATEKALNMLKHLGIQVTIKDFGVGHLSLQQLKHLPIDCVKISSELIKEITVNKETEAVIKMIIALTNSIGLSVAAEGVSTEKQMNLLKELGCKQMQGDYFCSPIKSDEFTKQTVELRTLT